MKTLCLCAAVFALTLVNAAGQSKVLTNDPLTGLPLIPATVLFKNVSNKPDKLPDGQVCKSSPAACDFNSYSNSSLKWDGKQLTIDLEFPQNGKKMTWHEIWSGITATSFTQNRRYGRGGQSAEESGHNSRDEKWEYI